MNCRRAAETAFFYLELFGVSLFIDWSTLTSGTECGPLKFFRALGCGGGEK